VGPILDAAHALPEAARPSIWLVCELPTAPETLPDELLADLRASGHLCVVEEHVAHGGIGQMLARDLALRGLVPRRMTHRHARGYPSGRYGSQAFHRRESGLDPESVLAELSP
jgi:transketolase